MASPSRTIYAALKKTLKYGPAIAETDYAQPQARAHTGQGLITHPRERPSNPKRPRITPSMPVTRKSVRTTSLEKRQTPLLFPMPHTVTPFLLFLVTSCGSSSRG